MNTTPQNMGSIPQNIKRLGKKLSEIEKLKIRQANGETLESNQLTKIAKEKEFREELEKLKQPASFDEILISDELWYQKLMEKEEEEAEIEEALYGPKYPEDEFMDDMDSHDNSDLLCQLSRPPEHREYKTAKDVGKLNNYGGQWGEQKELNVLTETNEMWVIFNFSHIEEGKGKWCPKNKSWQKYHTAEFDYGKIYVPNSMVFKNIYDKTKGDPEREFLGLIRFMGPHVEIPWRLQYAPELCHFEYTTPKAITGSSSKLRAELYEKDWLITGDGSGHRATMKMWNNL
tara:strand:+ start:2581 stop:3444 length:864 start_codon:yes stop_codon:yes gene_type:complete